MISQKSFDIGKNFGGNKQYENALVTMISEQKLDSYGLLMMDDQIRYYRN